LVAEKQTDSHKIKNAASEEAAFFYFWIDPSALESQHQ
jgi:hypothetical protein